LSIFWRHAYDETNFPRCRGRNLRRGIRARARLLRKQSHRKRRQAARRRRKNLVHEEVRGRCLRRQGSWLGRQAARRRRQDQLHEEVRKRRINRRTRRKPCRVKVCSPGYVRATDRIDAGSCRGKTAQSCAQKETVLVYIRPGPFARVDDPLWI